MKVTTLSNYADDVWYLKADYKAQSSCGAIYFSGVWQRNPKMKETLKAFLWGKRQGTLRGKVNGWGSLYGARGKLKLFAEILEKRGHSSFATLAPTDVFAVVAELPKNRAGRNILAWAIRMYRENSLPHIPKVTPFGHFRAVDLISENGVNQTNPIKRDVVCDIVQRCAKYEKLLPVALQLKEKWDDAAAIGIGVANGRDLNVLLRDIQTAGCLMLMAATGVRICELLTFRRGCLRCEQIDGKPVWNVWGTVYKFYGDEGRYVPWSGGSLGRRAIRILEAISPSDVLVCKLMEGRGEVRSEVSVGRNLASWFAAQEWRDVDGNPLSITTHQFRRTMGRNLKRLGCRELAIKEQFKHKSIWMTEYYIGADGDFRDELLAEAPVPVRSHEEAMANYVDEEEEYS